MEWNRFCAITEVAKNSKMQTRGDMRDEAVSRLFMVNSLAKRKGQLCLAKQCVQFKKVF